jgi:hydroxypyruvate reductase
MTSPDVALQDLQFVTAGRASPSPEVLRNLSQVLPRPPKGRTAVVGAGSVAARMAESIERLWPASAPLSGIVLVQGGSMAEATYTGTRIGIFDVASSEADGASDNAAAAILRAVMSLTHDDLVVCLFCPEAGDLLNLPAANLTYKEERRIHRELRAKGASLEECLCVEKHFSLLKGGRLAAACAPARVVTLLVDARPAANFSHFAGGPTTADASTCNDVLAVVRRYGVDLPSSILSLLTHGELETPKPGEPHFMGNELHVLGCTLATL